MNVEAGGLSHGRRGAFPQLLWTLLENSTLDPVSGSAIIEWCDDGVAFVIRDGAALEAPQPRGSELGRGPEVDAGIASSRRGSAATRLASAAVSKDLPSAAASRPPSVSTAVRDGGSDVERKRYNSPH